MIHLLDVNVLIALSDADHPQRAAALRFFEHRAVREGWATCLLTENAFLRIQGRPNAERGFGDPLQARCILTTFLSAPGHQFWPDDLSLTDSQFFPTLPASKNLTDIYLLALAVKHGARFATFDTGIDTAVVPGGPQAYYLIPSV